MEEKEVIERLRQRVGADNVSDVSIPRARRIFLRLPSSVLREAVRYLAQEEAFVHLSTISGVDVGDAIEVVYHLSRGGADLPAKAGIELSLKVRLSRDEPSLPTLTDVIPGSVLYEREVHDLLGVVFEGHPDLSPLVLPEGWPAHVKPLRKEWTIERIREEITKVMP